MAWKIREIRKWLYLIVLVAVLLRSCASTAHASTVYDGNIGTTYLTYFRDILGKLDFDDDYVCFRAGQYEYIMATGDLSFDDGIFSSDEVKCYVFSSSNTTYNSYTLYSTYDEVDFYLETGDKIVYSNLGDYPQLEERSDVVENAIFVLIFIAFVMHLIRSIFKHAYR